MVYHDVGKVYHEDGKWIWDVMKMGNRKIKAGNGERRWEMASLVRGMSRRWEILMGGFPECPCMVWEFGS